MRRITLDRPFIDGVVTDQPAYKIGPRNSTSAQDLVAPRGLATQRRGWAYHATGLSIANALRGVARYRFILQDATRTLVTTSGGDIYVHIPASTATRVHNGTAEYLPRTFYRDEIIFCAQDGETPLRRYAGALQSSYTNAASTFTANRALITATASNYGSRERGMYIFDKGSGRCFKVVDTVSNTSLTIEDMYATATLALVSPTTSPTGVAAPCISVYSAGTVNCAGATPDTLTGTGTVWSGSTWGDVLSYDAAGIEADAVLMFNSISEYELDNINTVNSSTSLALSKTRAVTDQPHDIVRRMPFRDAQAHKGSLFGTGVFPYPNRLYIGPPGWNISYPPGYINPFDPTLRQESPNKNDFLMDFIDVPASYDGDSNVALLSSFDPLCVLKRKSAWGVYGSYPNFERVMLPNGSGAGCIDIRSAATLGPGPVWAGEDDIFWFATGQVEGLMAGKISREWRSITGDFDFDGANDYCSIGEAEGHLLVSIMTGDGASHRCLAMDMSTGAWVSNAVTNHKARYFFTSRVREENEMLLWIGDDQTSSVMDSAPIIESGLAKDGDGDSPLFDAYTGEGMDGEESIDRESLVADIAVSANILDAGSAGSTSVDVKLISAGSLYTPAAVTTSLGTINSDTVDRPDRVLYDPINIEGRTHQIRVTRNALGTNTNNTKIQVTELSITLDDRPERT